jgi:Protein of unknown function (DUF3558)
VTRLLDIRRLCGIALAVAMLGVAACGSDSGEQPAALPGSPENPLVAKTSGTNEGAPREPGYQALVDAQGSKPESTFTPCDLVTQSQARTILGVAIEEPLEAKQGPTCVYQSRDGKAFVTLAIEDVDFGQIKRQLRMRESVDVGGETAYCGNYGQPMLYLPLDGGRVLSVAGHCATAKRFASRALAQLAD